MTCRVFILENILAIDGCTQLYLGEKANPRSWRDVLDVQSPVELQNSGGG